MLEVVRRGTISDPPVLPGTGGAGVMVEPIARQEVAGPMTEIPTRDALGDLLVGWLPRQRWFPGRGALAGGLEIISDETLLDGEPQLRHLIVEAGQARGPAWFQVLIGCRRQLPPAVAADAVIGQLPGLVCYDALHDPELAAVLLRGIADQRSDGPLQFVRETPVPETPAHLAGLGDSRMLTAEQSNTSLVFGEAAILKVLRRLFPGANPDLEVADALARLGSTRVATPFGWIETRIDDQPVLLAVLSEFLAGASDGWAVATDSVGRLYAREAAYGQEYLTVPVSTGRPATSPVIAGPDDNADVPSGDASTSGNAGTLPFAALARQLGEATAQMHADMATAFGRRDMTRAELTALSGALTAKLEDAVTIVPELGDHADRIAAAYDAVARMDTPVTVQRIHGDYHLGQVLYSSHGWVALDFEGEPAAPLAERRALAPALRDVAGMLRSFDYAARHQLVGHPAADALAPTASAWTAECQREFCAGYSAGGGADPDTTLLRALMLEKAVYEVIYEYRHRPGWLSIPLDYVAVS
jgi:maltokinase